MAAPQQRASKPACVYLNPNIPETQQIHDVYTELLGPMEPLQIQQQIEQNLKGSQAHDKMSIQEFLQINPETHKNMRFTVHATVIKIDNTDILFYNKCNVCGKHMDEEYSHWHCHESGTHEVPNYGYCFKAILQDEIGSIPAKIFSPQADKWTENCLQVLQSTTNKDPYTIPAALIKLENARKSFGLHFGTGSNKRKPKFVIHSVDDIAPPLLPPHLPVQTKANHHPTCFNLNNNRTAMILVVVPTHHHMGQLKHPPKKRVSLKFR